MRAADQAARLSPGCGWILAWRGALHLKKGEFREALRDLNAAVRLSPEYAPARLWRGQALKRLGKLEEALRDFEDAIRLEPAEKLAEPVYGRVYLERAQLFAMLKNWPAAARAYREAFERDAKYSWVPYQSPRDCESLLPELNAAHAAFPKDVFVGAWRAWCLYASGKTAEAVQALPAESEARDSFIWMVLGYVRDNGSYFKRAAALSPSPVYRQALGYFLRRRGENASALKELIAASKGGAPSAVLLWEIALLSLDCAKPAQAARFLLRALRLRGNLPPSGKEEDALRLCSALMRKMPRSRDILLHRAEMLKRLNRPSEALKDWDALVRLFPREAAFRVERSLLRRLAGDFYGACEDAASALRLKPSDMDARCAMSEAQRGLGRFPESLKQAELAVKENPREDYPRLIYAKILRQAGRLNDALKQARLASAFNPKNAKALAWQGEILRKSGRAREALKAVNLSIEADSSCAWAAVLKGEILRDLKKPGEALQWVKRGIQMEKGCSCAHDFLGLSSGADPAYAWVHAWRGIVFWRENAFEQAVSGFDKALALDPDCFWARACRQEALAQGRKK